MAWPYDGQHRSVVGINTSTIPVFHGQRHRGNDRPRDCLAVGSAGCHALAPDRRADDRRATQISFASRSIRPAAFICRDYPKRQQIESLHRKLKIFVSLMRRGGRGLFIVAASGQRASLVRQSAFGRTATGSIPGKGNERSDGRRGG